MNIIYICIYIHTYIYYIVHSDRIDYSHSLNIYAIFPHSFSRCPSPSHSCFLSVVPSLSVPCFPSLPHSSRRTIGAHNCKNESNR